MKKVYCLLSLISVFLVSCMENEFGNQAGVDPANPKSLVIIHTTDTHGKYFPFWLEPNMFDKAMGLTSSQSYCWDIDSGGSSGICDTETEDINKDGLCDLKDCQRCWDINGNGACDAEEDVDGVAGCDTTDCDLLGDKAKLCWDNKGYGNNNGQPDSAEDMNNDKNLDYNDCTFLWDSNHNYKCDYPYISISNAFEDEDGNLITSDNPDYLKVKAASEDRNRDGKCDKDDYHPGLVYAGGVARAATVMKRIRAEHPNEPVMYLDSGDTFQGAPEFNLYKGEVEMRSIQALGVSAMTIGNHEFDNGTSGLVAAYKNSGGFPLLASNYLFYDQNNKGLMNLVMPYVVINKGNLKIGIVGVGNDSSLTSIYNVAGSLGFNAFDPIETAQRYVDELRPRVDLMILLSHQGLDGDYEMAEKVKGVDLVLGGHHHVVLDPVKVLKGVDGRDVLVVHSGVNFKVVGALKLIVQKKNRDYPEIVWHEYKTPVVDDSVPEDATIATILKPYKQGLDYQQNIKAVIGNATATILRNDTNGGDSPLGNIVTKAMMIHDLVRAQFAVTNSMGIRADIPTGEITREKLYEVFPFENTVATMYLNGKEIKELFDFVARKSSGRGCSTQVQASGIHVVLDCSPELEIQQKYNSYALTKELSIGDAVVVKNYELVDPFSLFKMATNDYMGGGGSGFYMLEKNTTLYDTSVSLRDAVIEYIESLGGEVDPADFTSSPDNRVIQMKN